jgi:hypothetical protein
MSPNVRLSSAYKVAATGAPVSVAAAGTLVSGYFHVDSPWVTALLSMGVGAGTTAVTWQQATDASGTGAKALDTGDFAATGPAIVSLSATDDGKTVVAEGRAEHALDVAGGFEYIQCTATVTGGAGTLLSMVLMQGPARYSA